MRCLLLSAYHAHSHAYWCDGVMANFPHIQWEQLTLPARYFNWRIRGNAISLLAQYPEQLSAPADAIVATSMTDLVGLKALAPHLAGCPSVLYFHENQFDYPANDAQQARLEPQMMTLYSALVANYLVFNSCYNCNTFFAGVSALVRKLPDGLPKNLVADLQAKARVLPVPLNPAAHPGPSAKAGRLTVIWNHRWEHDKAPERLYEALVKLREKAPGCALTVHLVGQSFRKVPAVFAKIKQLLEEEGWAGAWGFQQARADYNRLLAESHFAISTALHDFQGLAMLEAAAYGAQPILPRRLAYPEWFSESAARFYGSHPEDVHSEAQALAEVLVQAVQGHYSGAAMRGHAAATEAVAALGWGNLRAAYGQLFDELQASAGLMG
ncbi:DUF3524 domain-containing protein [Simiduia sp. 21SJ11W-1]|uniref:tRNA-queuosine alpha-mannosyltransferase domain-containing protein n=1 Tax=Simiduia sp. 21SJ11W-1 TaxID=2909669 RepID=UPI00209DC17E|nr:DUF3524 domain-containing protein [Simiduia sp. 21SJ11W-1]UTA49421.1 DUF3524 domain-containing protein [Simiduia sp. 21SJ11W-1]